MSEWEGVSDGERWKLEVDTDCFAESEPFVVSVWITYSDDEGDQYAGACLSSEQAREAAAVLLRVADNVDFNNNRPDVLAARAVRENDKEEKR